jgi:hypothetical protein
MIPGVYPKLFEGSSHPCRSFIQLLLNPENYASYVQNVLNRDQSVQWSPESYRDNGNQIVAMQLAT